MGLWSAGTETEVLAILTRIKKESRLSQIFVAFDLSRFIQPNNAAELVNEVIHRLQIAPMGDPIRYPGQRTLQARSENMAKGIPVPASTWRDIQEL